MASRSERESLRASGLPIQILTFSNRHFTNVTRSYPKLVASDAARWLRAYHRTSKQDSVGLIAAWAADEFLLGHRRLVSRYLEQEAKAGHLNSALPGEPSGKRFIARLATFLRRHGYAR